MASASFADAAWPDAAHDTVGALLAHIATALQDTLRLLMFADKRGWGPDEFEQVRAVEDALDEARRDFQTMAPLVNGQFYYEGDRRVASLNELRALRADVHAHAQVFRDWIRSGGPINPLWARDTLALRRRLHRAQCRAACRIFTAEHQDPDGSASGARCLGAFLLYRRLRENADARRAYAAAVAAAAAAAAPVTTTADAAETPAWKQQQPQLHAREKRQSVGREPMSASHSTGQTNGQPPARRRTVGFVDSVDGSVDGSTDGFVLVERTRPQSTPASQQPPPRSALKQNRQQNVADSPGHDHSHSHSPDHNHNHDDDHNHDHDHSHQSPPPLPPPPPPLTLEDLVPDCRAVGSFERFGDYDIAFICDFCDGHIVWEDVQRLPTSRDPPPAVSSADETAAHRTRSSSSAAAAAYPLPLALKLQPLQRPTSAAPTSSTSSATPSSSTSPARRPPADTAAADTAADADAADAAAAYPRWQATAVAASRPDAPPRTIVFAPLAVANHLPPPPGAWEARLWCPYCDAYLYFDSAAGDQARYAQDEHGFDSLADFQAHLAWHHTALPLPALPALPTLSTLSSAAKDSCAVM